MSKWTLVTGGCGYIGSHVVQKLIEAEKKVVVIDNLSSGSPKALISPCPLIVGDLEDMATLRSLFKEYPIDSLLHFASSIAVEESIQQPLAYYRNNVENFLRLLEVAGESGPKKIILSSTAAVYGAVTSQSPIHEHAAVAPINPYGRSKMMDELILKDTAQQFGHSYVILRYFNVAGADQLGRIGQVGKRSTHLIKIACEVAVGKRDHLTVFGVDYPTPDGTCIRDYIHVEDLAEAHVSALHYLEEGRPSVTLNCGYNQGYSVQQVLRAVEEVGQCRVKTMTGKRRLGDAPFLVADNSQILQTLDWLPKRNDLGTIVGSALRWEQKLLERETAF